MLKTSFDERPEEGALINVLRTVRKPIVVGRGLITELNLVNNFCIRDDQV